LAQKENYPTESKRIQLLCLIEFFALRKVDDN